VKDLIISFKVSRPLSMEGLAFLNASCQCALILVHDISCSLTIYTDKEGLPFAGNLPKRFCCLLGRGRCFG